MVHWSASTGCGRWFDCWNDSNLQNGSAIATQVFAFERTTRTNVELILWRHAEAEDKEPDSERCLTERGRKHAKRMAEWLKSKLLSEMTIIASPAVRAQHTALALSTHFLTLPEIGLGASVKTFIKAVNWPQASGTVIAVGHQPTVGRVAAYLLSGKEAEWNIKKGAIWWITHRPEEDGKQVLLKACLSPNLL